MVRDPLLPAWLLPIAIVICTAVMVGPVSATTVSIDPQQITPGQPVTITITSLPDSTTMAICLRANISVTPGSDYTFQTNAFSLPFTLENGKITAKMEGTDYNSLEIQKGDTIVKKVGRSRDGLFSTENAGTIPNGTYEYIRFSGTILPDTSHILAEFTMEGIKKGPGNSAITFSVAGITSGAVGVTVTVGGSELLNQDLQVGSGATVPTQTTTVPTTTAPVNTTATTTTSATSSFMGSKTSGGSSGGSGGSSGGSGGGGGGSSSASSSSGSVSAAPGTTPDPDTAPTGTLASSPAVPASLVTVASTEGATAATTTQGLETPATSTGRPATTKAAPGLLLPVIGLAGAILALSRRTR